MMPAPAPGVSQGFARESVGKRRDFSIRDVPAEKGGVRFVPVSKKFVARVDEADFELVKDHKWYLVVRAYAAANINGKIVYMHRIIAGAKPGQEVDHIDRDPLNNTRENLRLCTRAENAKNQPRYRNNTTGYKGVHKSGRIKNPWRAQIRVNGRDVSLGNYATAEQAHHAYCEAAKKLHGDFHSTK